MAQSEQHISTRYFLISYPGGEEKAANWYAGFVDDVDTSVSELLGAQPVEGLTMRIYATEAEYTQANPMAEIHPGILAHAIPERKEIGVAVERLRLEDPGLARETFRHEMTHVIAGALSDQNLPVGFQEGLAQYNELSTSRGEEVVTALKEARATGSQLLSWSDLNDRQLFRFQLDVAYPESYSVMAFLADRYGMGKYAAFLSELRHNPDFKSALNSAYGKSIEQLETEWRDYLPGFLKDGWQQNHLAEYDLNPGIALYQVGHYAEAKERFVSSKNLYTDLGRDEQAKKAADYIAKAEKAQGADDSASQARKALEAHDYSTAQQKANKASQDFASLALKDGQGHADEISQLAERGLDAQATFKRARDSVLTLNLGQARTLAQQAGQSFGALGDDVQVAQVNNLLRDLWNWQRYGGAVAMGVGILSVLAAAVGVVRVRRRRMASAAITTRMREESVSWM